MLVTTDVRRCAAGGRDRQRRGVSRDRHCRLTSCLVNPGPNDTMAGFPLQGLNILVVDDDPRVRRLYAIVLREAGATVTASGTAAEAVQLADLQPTDVVVTDLRMPGHDGIWLLRQLKSHMPTMPVIVVTGDTEAPGDEDLRSLGFAKVLRKPLILSCLTAAVSDAVRRAG